MSDVIHPNFRIKDQKNIAERDRAIMITVPQRIFDLISSEVDYSRAESINHVIAQALEKYFTLPPGAAKTKGSDLD